MIAELENALIVELDKILDSENVRLRLFPDNPKDFGHALSMQVLVGYRRSVFKAIQEHPISQVETYEFEVTLQMPSLRTHQGAYLLMDLILVKLTGFNPPNYINGFRCTGRRLVEFDPKDGVWVYSMTWNIDRFVYEDMAITDPDLIIYPDDWAPSSIVTGIWRSKLPDVSTPNPHLDRVMTIQVAP